MANNAKQRRNGKLLGGVTGRGFLPGRSGNPLGRPRTTGLLEALRAKMFEIEADGRSVAEHVAEALVDESLRGRQRIAAASLILDRLEGRPPQQLDLNNITGELDHRRDDELRFYLQNSHWPEQRGQYEPSSETTAHTDASTETKTQ